MAEEMILKCTEKYLAGAADEFNIERVSLFEFRFPWDDYHFSTHRFFVVRHRLMDNEDCDWDHFHNDLRSAMADFGKEWNKKWKEYGKVEYCSDWWHYRDELIPDDPDDDGRRSRSASEGDYGPSNPWDAPGMKISDFIKGVY